MSKLAQKVFLFIVGILILTFGNSTWAQFESSLNIIKYKPNALEVVTNALGVEYLNEYSVNDNAIGFNFAQNVGIEISYLSLSSTSNDSHHGLAGRSLTESDNRIDLKIALDLSKPVSRVMKLFSKIGLYVWDLDVRYNNDEGQFYASEDGTSVVFGVGSVFTMNKLRFSFELEKLMLKDSSTERAENRFLFIVGAKL